MPTKTPTGEVIEDAQARPSDDLNITEGPTNPARTEQSVAVDTAFEESRAPGTSTQKRSALEIRTIGDRTTIFDPRRRGGTGLAGPAGSPTSPMEAETLDESANIINERQRKRIAEGAAVPTRTKATTAPVVEKEVAITAADDIAGIKEAADKRVQEIMSEPSRLSVQKSEIAAIRAQEKDEIDDIEAAEKLTKTKDPTFASEVSNAKLGRYNSLRDQGVSSLAAIAQVEREITDLKEDPAKIKLGQEFDAIMEANDDDVTRFGKLFDVAKNSGSSDVIGDSFDVFKSRVGEAKAKQVRDNFLKVRGFDEQDIADENFASSTLDLYSGEESSISSLNVWAKNLKANYSPEFQVGQLNSIIDSPLANQDIKDEARNILGGIEKDLGIKEDLFGDGGTNLGFYSDLAYQAANGYISSAEFKELTKDLTASDQAKVFAERTRIQKDVMGETPEKIQTIDAIMQKLPTKLKDAVRENVQRRKEISRRIDALKDSGISEEDLIQKMSDEIKGFRITKGEYEPLGNFLRSKASIFPSINISTISDSLNLDAPSDAILALENEAMPIDKDYSQASTDNILTNTTEIIDLIDEVGDDVMGAMDTNMFKSGQFIATDKFREFFGQDKEGLDKALQLGARLALLMAEERRTFGGTALTDTEAKFLKPLIAEMTDQPSTAKGKLRAIANTSLINHNSARRQAGLPTLDTAQEFLDPDVKLQKYLDESANLGTEVSPFTYRSISKMSPDQFIQYRDSNPDKIEALTDTQLDNLPLDVRQRMLEEPQKKKTKLTDVSQIKDFDRVETVMGTGTATGIEGGSSFNAAGFDFVVDGGMGAPVKAPFSGKIIEINSGFENKTGVPLSDGLSQNDGWGNQMKIELEDGTQVWINHLDSVEGLEEGGTISQGDLIGTQGNTGRTKGNTGVHVDITMIGPDGKKLASREVAGRMGTVKA